MILEDLDFARLELRTKGLLRIETETASKWGARALAAMEKWKETSDVQWYNAAVGFGHEAVEHAAFAEAGVLQQVQSILLQHGVPIA